MNYFARPAFLFPKEGSSGSIQINNEYTLLTFRANTKLKFPLNQSTKLKLNLLDHTFATGYFLKRSPCIHLFQIT